MNKTEILSTVRSQLAIDMNCKTDDFLREGITFIILYTRL